MVRVWLECHGENPGDVENLGPITYYPGTGFPASYYPYLNQVGSLWMQLGMNYYDLSSLQEGYLSPIVFARLESPTSNLFLIILPTPLPLS